MIGNRYSRPSAKRRVDKQTWEREVIPLLGRLAAHDPEVAASAIDVIRRTLPSYRDVADEALEASARRNSSNAIKLLTARRLPGEKDLSSAAIAAGERARQGVPVQDALAAYRFSMHEIREFLTDAASRSGCSPDALLEMTRLLWELTDAVSIRMATAHQAAQLEVARHDARQRTEFLRGLVSGSLGPAEIRRLGPAYNLTLDSRYVALRGRPAADTTTSELIRALAEPARVSGRHAFIDVLEGEVFGVSPVVPDAGRCPGTVGVGPFADLASIETSFATASRVVKVAERFGLVGLYRLQDLALRAAVAAEDDIGALLVERYLEPLKVLGSKAEAVQDTVGVYLEEGLNFKATAQRLQVHQNTVRYRVVRFEELTRTRLDHPYSAFEVWWALQRAQLRADTDSPGS
jgi:putative transposase